MKKNLVLSSFTFLFAAILVILTGCPTSKAPLPAGTGPAVKPNTTSNEGIVEPLVPTEGKKEGTNFVPAQPFGKISAEAFPMPPIADLVGQIDEYIEKLGKTLDDLDGTPKYKEDNEFIVRDANALTLVALAAGKAEADSKYKKAAPGIIKAAAELAAAGNLDDGKKAYTALKASLASESDPASLEWTKIAELKPLMKAVPNLNSLLTRLTNTEAKLKKQIGKKPEQVFGTLAALAVISQGSVANVKETSKPDAADEWKKECEQFRDAALKANAAAHGFADGKVDYKEYWDSCKAMTETCDTCHKVFHPGAIGHE